MSKIAVVKGNDRRENITKALKFIEKDIEKEIKNKNSKKLFIKINAIDTNFPLACTHPEALESVLDFFYNKSKLSRKFNEIIIGDNTFIFTKYKGGIYKSILKKFPEVKLSDLTEFETEKIEFKILNRKTSIGKISLLPKQAFTVSLALPKTHDAFVYTGCLKNMFGCVIKNKGSLHAQPLYGRFFIHSYIRSNKLKWDNLVNAIKKTMPDLSILDAYEGMEGEGPMLGIKIQLGFAMCSLDGIGLDMSAAKICGLSPVPYLEMLKKSSSEHDSEIIKSGFNSFDEISKKFKPHYNNAYQKSTSVNFLFFPIDFRFLLSVLKRSYRIKDKVIDKLKEKIKR